MSDDYVCLSGRKSKGDKRAKGRYMRYKKGGAQRATNIQISNQPSEKPKN